MSKVLLVNEDTQYHVYRLAVLEVTMCTFLSRLCLSAVCCSPGEARAAQCLLNIVYSVGGTH